MQNACIFVKNIPKNNMFLGDPCALRKSEIERLTFSEVCVVLP